GIRTGRDRPSDAEYIESIRKALRLSCRMRIFFALLTVGGFAFFLWAFLKMLEMLVLFGQRGGINPQQQNIAIGLYIVAVILGLFIGISMSNLLSHAAQLLFEDRKDRLLVKCWDAMFHLMEAQGIPEA